MKLGEHLELGYETAPGLDCGYFVRYHPNTCRQRFDKFCGHNQLLRYGKEEAAFKH